MGQWQSCSPQARPLQALLALPCQTAIFRVHQDLSRYTPNDIEILDRIIDSIIDECRDADTVPRCRSLIVMAPAHSYVAMTYLTYNTPGRNFDVVRKQFETRDAYDLKATVQGARTAWKYMEEVEGRKESVEAP